MKGKKSNYLRYAVQIFFFIIVGAISTNHVLEEIGYSPIPFISNASIHAVCPFGGVVSLYNLATLGRFVQKIHQSSFVLMILTLMVSALFGAVVCGWVCPLGSVQEWFGKLGKKVFKKRYNQFISYKYDKILRYLRYGVLIWVVYVTALTSKLFFSDLDPLHALFSFWSGNAALPSLIILVLTIVLSLFVERPWCKYACPMGAVYGIFNGFRVFKVRRSESSCIDCHVCDKNCPMNVPVSAWKVVRDHQCIGCLNCTSDVSCPVADTVQLSL